MNPVAKNQAERFTEVVYKFHDYIQEWAPKLGLERWDLKLVFEYVGSEENYFAKVAPDWTYLRANMTVRLTAFLESSDSEIEAIVLHELLHCVVNPMSKQETRTDASVNCEEFVVSNLTKCFLNQKYSKN